MQPRVMVHAVCTSSYRAKHLCDVSTFQTVFKLHSGHKYVVEMAIFNVQRAITPKVCNRVVVPMLCTFSHGA